MTNSMSCFSGFAVLSRPMYLFLHFQVKLSLVKYSKVKSLFLSLSLSVFSFLLFLFLSVFLSVSPSFFLSLALSFFLSFRLSLSFLLFLSLSFSLSISPSQRTGHGHPIHLHELQCLLSLSPAVVDVAYGCPPSSKATTLIANDYNFSILSTQWNNISYLHRATPDLRVWEPANCGPRCTIPSRVWAPGEGGGGGGGGAPTPPPHWQNKPIQGFIHTLRFLSEPLALAVI